MVKNQPVMQETQEVLVLSLGWEDPSPPPPPPPAMRKWQPTPVFLPWAIPLIEEPGALQSMVGVGVAKS